MPELAFFCIHANCEHANCPYARWYNLQRHNKAKHSADSSVINLANGQEVAAKKLARLFHFQRAADPGRDANAVTKGRQGALAELRDYEKKQVEEKVKSAQAKAADISRLCT